MTVNWGFALLSIAVAAAAISMLRSSGLKTVLVGWMILSAISGFTGVLTNFERLPPPAMLLFFLGFLSTTYLGLSRFVQPLIALPLRLLVGFQAFRILVEILIHQSSTIGLAPPQMTWNGMNFDIVTGVTAALIAPIADRLPRWLIIAWNCMGLGLLTWVVTVAVVSFPSPFQILKPDNLWVTQFSYVWLPTVLVPAALLGHIVCLRKMWRATSVEQAIRE
ncbi:MAG: hypothetical protein ABL921_14175 [Pirellula sp.]